MKWAFRKLKLSSWRRKFWAKYRCNDWGQFCMYQWRVILLSQRQKYINDTGEILWMGESMLGTCGAVVVCACTQWFRRWPGRIWPSRMVVTRPLWLVLMWFVEDAELNAKRNFYDQINKSFSGRAFLMIESDINKREIFKYTHFEKLKNCCQCFNDFDLITQAGEHFNR